MVCCCRVTGPRSRAQDDRLFLKARKEGLWLEWAWARRDLTSAPVFAANTSRVRDQGTFWQMGYDAEWGDQRGSSVVGCAGGNRAIPTFCRHRTT